MPSLLSMLPATTADNAACAMSVASAFRKVGNPAVWVCAETFASVKLYRMVSDKQVSPV